MLESYLFIEEDFNDFCVYQLSWRRIMRRRRSKTVVTRRMQSAELRRRVIFVHEPTTMTTWCPCRPPHTLTSLTIQVRLPVYCQPRYWLLLSETADFAPGAASVCILLFQ